MKLRFNQPGYLYSDVEISPSDVKCALLRIDKQLFDTDIERDKLFSQEIIKTESELETQLCDIYIERSHVMQLYSDHLKLCFELHYLILFYR